MWHWIWWLTCCCIPWSRLDPYQIALKKYLHEFNQVLEPYVKHTTMRFQFIRKEHLDPPRN